MFPSFFDKRKIGQMSKYKVVEYKLYINLLKC